MPKTPIDYKKTVIYKIVCDDLEITDCYVGSTTDFIRRKSSHKSNCNNEKSKEYNHKIYKIIREFGNWDNWTMVEIQKFPCEDSNEARKQERYHYEILNSNLNMRYPERTDKEYKNQYQDKEKYRRQQKINCECGKVISYNHISKHKKTVIHLNFLTNNVIT
jgi:hypothetical protein